MVGRCDKGTKPNRRRDLEFRLGGVGDIETRKCTINWGRRKRKSDEKALSMREQSHTLICSKKDPARKRVKQVKLWIAMDGGGKKGGSGANISKIVRGRIGSLGPLRNKKQKENGGGWGGRKVVEHHNGGGGLRKKKEASRPE